jgi:hypothetical protein
MNFQPGHAPTPGAGRPRGARNKLAARFFEMLLKVMTEPVEREGDPSQSKDEAALRILYVEKPHEFLKLVASVLPAEIQFDTPMHNMSDEELAAAIEKLRQELRPPPLMIESRINGHSNS